MHHLRRLALALCLLCPALVVAQPPKTVEFNRDIRPILSDYCYTCHGPAKSTRKVDLRLDTKEGAMTVVAPRKLKDSLLWQRITSIDPHERMPPEKFGRKLSEQQISLLRDNLNCTQKVLDVLKLQRDNGVIQPIDYTNTEVSYNNTRSQLSMAENDLNLAQNRLDRGKGTITSTNRTVNP